VLSGSADLGGGVADVGRDEVVDVVNHRGGAAQLPVGGGLDGLGDAVAHGDARGLLVVKDEGEDDLLGAVAGLVVGVVLEEVGGALGEVDVVGAAGNCGVLGCAILVDEEDAGGHNNARAVLVVVRVGDRERAASGAGGAAGGAGAGAAGLVGDALLGPVLAGRDGLGAVRLGVRQVVGAVDGAGKLEGANGALHVELDHRGGGGRGGNDGGGGAENLHC